MEEYQVYNALIPTMEKLDKEGFNIWEFHNAQQGFGFNVILKNEFIRVFIIQISYDTKECDIIITKNEKTNNILLGKEIERTETKDYKEVYSIIKKLVK